ncbi:MAG: insulinase family protein [Mariniblastus sp.]|nr:insulinase family protein [Mariniblastus sp.]
MEYRQHQLDNGLTILAECNPRAYMSAFGFFVKAGSCDETPSIGGVSHFLEHMVYKGTPNRSAEQVNLELDEMGCSSNANARTSEESTIYHAAVLPEFQSQMIHLMSDLMRPSLREVDFETEKKVIIEEIMMYQDQPPYGGHEQIMANFFGEHPLGQSVLGTVDTVSGLSPHQMREYFDSRYSPGNIAFAAAGDVDFEQMVVDLERICGDWQPVEVGRVARRADYHTGFDSLHQPSSQQQYLLQLSPGPSAESPDRYAARVATTILGDDSGSRMYWDFLDPGVAESAGAGSYEYLNNGLVMTYICCSPEMAQENLARLKKLQDQFLDHGITQKELDLAKRKIASHIVLSSERTERRMFSVGAQWLINQPFKQVSEIAEIYDSITLAQVNDVIRKHPPQVNTTLVIGPQADLQPVP